MEDWFHLFLRQASGSSVSDEGLSGSPEKRGEIRWSLLKSCTEALLSDGHVDWDGAFFRREKSNHKQG